MDAKVSITGLTKDFGELRAVDNLTFSVAKGEVMGFLGPNGAGKSTTMKMITGFLAPTSGRVEVCGMDIEAEPIAVKRNIGYLPEGAPLYGDMKTRGFLDFIAEIRGYRGAEKQRRIDTAVARVELQGVMQQTVGTLSKGFKRRVGLAQAILHDPPVLILDEPTDGLDPNQKFEVRNLIREISADKVIIISTHILEEVDAVCSRALIIAEGRLLADGTPAELESRSRYHQSVVVELPPQEREPGVFAELASKLPGVRDVIAGGQPRTWRILPVAEQNIFEPVRALLAEQGWKASRLYIEKGHLDDVFRSLTRSGQSTATTAGEPTHE